ncbi:MAG: hypothetical protein WD717_03840 [Nitrosarchaeum sp.]
MVLNKEIQEYVKEKYGYSPKNAWIAHAKEYYGMSVNKAHNRVGDRKWGCPKKRLIEFKKIFEHFDML